MPAWRQTIEQLARDIGRTADSETALRALTALRGELDRVETDLVGRALEGGASWSQIARALGVSKQAAHRKYRHTVRETQTGAPAGEPKILVTSEARRCIQLAREEARDLGQPAMGTEHILLGILRCEQSHAMRALNALGVTHSAAKLSLQPTIVGPPPDPDSAGKATGAETGVSPHARRILEGSLREALQRQEGYIGVEHILLALLSDSRNGAVQTLETLKTTPAKIRGQLEREWQVTIGARGEEPPPQPHGERAGARDAP